MTAEKATKTKTKKTAGVKAPAKAAAKAAPEKDAKQAEASPAAPARAHARSSANPRTEKLRNLAPAELEHQAREMRDQLFRLKFQLKMGQTESLKKIRGLRKDIARIQTIVRARALGIEAGVGAAEKR